MGGAALFYAVVHNHAFHNGNKRTALVALIAFLDANGWVLHVEEDDLFEYVLTVAQHQVISEAERARHDTADRETLVIAKWLHTHMRKIQKGEFRIPFRALRRILSDFGCDFNIKKGNRIDIYRDGLKTQVFYSGEGMDVEQNSIHKIRRDLKLDDAHGYDSSSFYSGAASAPEFIARYRKILKRLADYDRAAKKEEALG